MNSSFSTLSASLLEIWSDILDIRDQLHTASIEFTVLRENNVPIGLEVFIQCLLAEQKPPVNDENPVTDVGKLVKASHER
jgi:hypothetical protein